MAQLNEATEVRDRYFDLLTRFIECIDIDSLCDALDEIGLQKDEFDNPDLMSEGRMQDMCATIQAYLMQNNL